MSRPKITKGKQKEIALERIKELFSQAEWIFNTNKSLAHRYVTLARKVAMKVKLQMPRELKRKYCKHCYQFLMPGSNSRVRKRAGKVVIYCMECKKFTRIPVIKKVKK